MTRVPEQFSGISFSLTKPRPMLPVRKIIPLAFICMIGSCLTGFAQSQPVDSLPVLSPDYYKAVSSRVSSLNNKIDKTTDKAVQQLSKREEKIRRKLMKIDSLKAKELFGDVKERYARLQRDAETKAGQLSKFSKVYNGNLDSLSTALTFLKVANHVNGDLENNVQKSLGSINSLQGKLDQAEQIKKYLRERKKLLTGELQKLGMLKELKKYNKQAYYYQQQIKEYKAIINDPSRLEQKLLETVTKIPAFCKFFANNSQLASLFNLPGSDNGSSSATVAGLQTRASVMQGIQSRFGSGPQVQQMMQQNIQSAQSQVNELKSKLAQYFPQGGSSDDDIPDFKPNNQRTKSFFQRLELGSNLQTQRSNVYFPVTSDIGLSVGYKLNDKSVIGIGASYKLGWGQGWNNIHMSSEGVGLRSYIDWKIKGSFFASGGYEQNYRTAFTSVQQLKDYSAWQQSGLIGVSKIVDVKNKLFKKTKLQLLFDFLSYQQVPRTQPLVFRIGYNF